MGFPGGPSGKEPACQCRRCKRCRFDPWVWKMPWRRAWKSTPVFLPGEPHGQRRLAAYSPWGRKELSVCTHASIHVSMYVYVLKSGSCQAPVSVEFSRQNTGYHSSKASILQHSAFFIVQLSHPYKTTGKTTALTRRTFVGKVMSLLFNMKPPVSSYSHTFWRSSIELLITS